MVYIQGYFVFNKATYLNIFQTPQKGREEVLAQDNGKKIFFIFTEKINIQSRTDNIYMPLEAYF